MGQKTNPIIFNLSSRNAEWKSKYSEKNQEESSVLLYNNLAVWNYLNKNFKQYGLILYNWKIEYNESSINIFLFFFEKETKTKKLYKQNIKRIKKNKHLKSSVSTYVNCPELIHYLSNILSKDLNLFANGKTIHIKAKNLNKKFEIFIKTNPLYLNEFKRLLRPFKRFLKNSEFKELIKILYSSVIEKDSAKLIAEGITSYFMRHKKKHGFILSFFKKVLTTLINANFSEVKGVKIIINGRFNGVQRANRKIIQVGEIPLQSFNSFTSYYEDVAYTPNGTFGIKVWVSNKSVLKTLVKLCFYNQKDQNIKKSEKEQF